MDLRKVRATVTDREGLGSLDPAAVRRYLRQTGWHEVDVHDCGSTWRLAAGRTDDPEIDISNRRLGDHAARMAGLLFALSSVEDRSQLAVLSDLLDIGEVRCPDCGSPLPIKVLCSAAGFYLGRWCERCGPFERVSVSYFRSRRAAETALASGDYDTRVYAIENQGVKG